MWRCPPSPTYCDFTSVTVPWKINSASCTSWSKVGGMTVVARAVLSASAAVTAMKSGRNVFIRRRFLRDFRNRKSSHEFRKNLTQLSGSVEIVDLDEANSGEAVHAAHDRGVAARREGCDDRAIERVRRR